MEQALTLVCKIQPTDDERTHLEKTLRAFADACAYIHATLPPRITNVMRMQAMLYYAVRGRFGLSSNLAQQAFRRVAANRKATKAQGETVKAFEPTSIQYDQRVFACLPIGSRKGKRFACAHCGSTGDADCNGAKNIQILGLSLSQPRGPYLHSLWPQVQGSQKPQALVAWVA